MTQQNPETTERQPIILPLDKRFTARYDQNKDSATPRTAPTMPLNPQFETRYDQNRDPFYGLERDPYTGRIDDCRDRD